MSLETCLNNAVSGNLIDPDTRAAMLRLYDGLLEHYGRADLARAEMVNRLMRQAAEERRRGLLSEDARERVEAYMLNYRNPRGEPDPAEALVALIEHYGQVRMPTGMSSVVGRYKSIAGLAQARMEAAIWEFRRTLLTGRTRSMARLENVLREARGEATNDPAARALAEVWMETSNWLRERFNAAGGAIGELANWGLPQVHDRAALLARGMEQWIADITPRLDFEQMRHHLTGEPLTAADLRASLEYIWRNVTTDGWAEREATAQRRGLGTVANQRADHRFLVFRSADDWLAYNRDYGGGADIFAAMMAHVKGMAEDIAAMEVLGPNPQATLTYLQNFVSRQAALRVAGDANAVFPTVATVTGRDLGPGGSWITAKNAEDYARDRIRLATDMWDLYRGAAGGVINQRIADVFGAARNLNVASKLGSAAISAVTDQGFQHMARQFAGLPMLGQWRDMFSAFRQGSKRDAVAAGLILDTALHVLHAEARWAGGMQGPGWSQVLADRTIAWSGLAAWTQAGKHAFGLATMAELRARADDDFAALHPNLQRTFERYGMGAAEWDEIRAVQGHEHFIRPADVYAQLHAAGRGNLRIGERYLEMILQETEYATPEGTLQTKARAYGGLARGTLRDEAIRSMGQFKMFGLSVVSLQAQRIAGQMIEDGVWRGAGYAAALLITSTLYGAAAMQMKNIVAGKDPRPMDGEHGWRFWGGAILQGGGLGIYGDFLASETSRTGGGFARTVMGPTGDLAASVLSMTSGNVAEFIRGEKTNVGREAVRFLGSNTPGGSLWYLRAAYEHQVLDRLQRSVDPEAYSAFRRKLEKTTRETGAGFWWRPGEAAPDRLPDFGGAGGR